MASILDLPAELKLRLLRHCNKKDLRSMRLVCRSFEPTATELAFREVYGSIGSFPLSLIVAILQYPKLGAFVRSIEVRVPPHSSDEQQRTQTSLCCSKNSKTGEWKQIPGPRGVASMYAAIGEARLDITIPQPQLNSLRTGQLGTLLNHHVGMESLHPVRLHDLFVAILLLRTPHLQGLRIDCPQGFPFVSAVVGTVLDEAYCGPCSLSKIQSLALGPRCLVQGHRTDANTGFCPWFDLLNLKELSIEWMPSDLIAKLHEGCGNQLQFPSIRKLFLGAKDLDAVERIVEACPHLEELGLLLYLASGAVLRFNEMAPEAFGKTLSSLTVRFWGPMPDNWSQHGSPLTCLPRLSRLTSLEIYSRILFGWYDSLLINICPPVASLLPPSLVTLKVYWPNLVNTWTVVHSRTPRHLESLIEKRSELIQLSRVYLEFGFNPDGSSTKGLRRLKTRDSCALFRHVVQKLGVYGIAVEVYEGSPDDALRNDGRMGKWVD